MVGAPDDVRDLEVEIVDRARDLIGRRPVRPQQGGAAEAERAVGVRDADQVRRLAMADEALALTRRPLVPADPQPLQVGEHALDACRNVSGRIGVVDPQQEGVAEVAVGDGAQSVPDMERACRAGSKTGTDGHGRG